MTRFGDKPARLLATCLFALAAWLVTAVAVSHGQELAANASPVAERVSAIETVDLRRNDLHARWDHGLVLESAAGEFGLRIGGRVQADASGFTAGAGPLLPPALAGLNPPLNGAANFRRARLRAGGQLAAASEWAAEFDFANQMTAYNAAFRR